MSVYTLFTRGEQMDRGDGDDDDDDPSICITALLLMSARRVRQKKTRDV